MFAYNYPEGMSGRCLESQYSFCGAAYYIIHKKSWTGIDGDWWFCHGWHSLLDDAPDSACKYFKNAAKFHHPYALHNLAICYFHGMGVAVFPEQAMRYCSLAKDALNKMEVKDEMLEDKICLLYDTLIRSTEEVKDEYSPLLKKP